MPTLRDYSVKFGRDPVQGLEGKNCFPYFYSLVNHNDIDWNPGILFDNTAALPVGPAVGDRYTAQYTANGWTKGLIYEWDSAVWNVVSPDLSTYAVLCKANAVTSHYVRLDPDYNYKLIAIKYAAFRANAGAYEWYENFNPASLYIQDLPAGSPYSGNIQVSLSVQGSGSQTLFGGQQAGFNLTGVSKIPLSIDCQQGYEYGFQALRCEYLIPLQGVLSFEFTNTHATKDLYVAAMMYGVKIRL